VNGRRIQLAGEKAVEFGAVHAGEAGLPALLHDLVGLVQQPSPVGSLDAGPGSLPSQAHDAIGQPDRPEGPEGVAPQANAGPDLFQLGCLLVDLGVQALAGEGDGGRHPRDSSTDNDNLSAHTRSLGHRRGQGKEADRLVF
jgi:hypothetical protein